MNKPLSLLITLGIALSLGGGTLAANPSGIEFYAKGDYYLQLDDQARAMLCFQEALKVDPALVESHYKLGKIYFAQESWQFARHHFEKFISQIENTSFLHLHLDAYFDLAQTHYRLGEGLNPKTDKNPHLIKMQDYLRQVISSFEDDGLIARHSSRYDQIVKEFYLAKAWYILARLYEDKNRDQEYPIFYRNALINLNKLREKEPRVENIVKIAFRETECLYALYRFHRRSGELSTANQHRESALAIQNLMTTRANSMLSDPARSFSPDISLYQAYAKNIELLLAGKIIIEPLFKFFDLK